MDFFIVINGINLDVLVPLCFSTLQRVVDLNGINIIVFVKPDVPENIKKYLYSLPVKVEELPIFTEKIGSFGKEVFWMAGDTALTCNHIIENYGNNKWKIISHFDVCFLKDITAVFKKECQDDVGMVSYHNRGIFAINKEAYSQCFVGTQSISGFYAVPENGAYKIRHGSDVRCTCKDYRIEGFDVFELMELNMIAKEWKIIPVPTYSYIYHIVAGSGYHGSKEIEQSQRKRALNLLQQYSIQPL